MTAIDRKTYSRQTEPNFISGGFDMRGLLLTGSLIAFSSVAMAENFNLTSAVSHVTAYPQGATVTRSIDVSVPAGSHRLLITDVPQGFDPASLRITGGEGLVIGATGFRDDRLPPDERQIAARDEIQDRIDAQRDRIQAQFDAKSAINLEVAAAKARVEFLEALSDRDEEETPSAEELALMVTLIGDQTLKALQDSHAARLKMANIDRDIEDLQEDLTKLEEELAAVALPLTDRVIVSLDVSAAAAVDSVLQISYVTNAAGWTPVYDVRLDQADEQMTIDRQAVLYQHTGETWEDVVMTVSTARPNLQLSPGELWGQLAFLYENAPMGGIQRERDVSSLAMAAPMAMADEVMVEEAEFRQVTLDFQGLTAVYHLPDPVRLDGDGAEALFTIDSTDFDVEMTARAIPLLDSNAYLYASVTNDSPAPYLPGRASFYRDGAFIGTTGFEMLASGITADLAFGAIDGITTERVTLFRETGEAGILTTSNDKREEYELKVENLSGRDWDVILYDRAPYSEQEDLEISVTSRPQPTIRDADGRRGVYGWEFALEAGAEASVRFEYTLGWPKDMELGLR